MGRLPRAAVGDYRDLIPALAAFRRGLTEQVCAKAKAKADKQIPPVPTDAHYIRGGLAECFSGELSALVSVFSERDSLSLALLPSNQCIAGEIVDPKFRAKLIEFLLRYEVLPAFYNGPAANPHGFNLHWTFGRYRSRS
jgi:hypothetical protein